jgi:predicted transcriptional regulator
MTTLTVHLEESLLKRTPEIAEARHATVDDVVADALQEVSQKWMNKTTDGESYEERRQRLEEAMKRYSGYDTGGPYTRDEMNER